MANYTRAVRGESMGCEGIVGNRWGAMPPCLVSVGGISADEPVNGASKGVVFMSKLEGMDPGKPMKKDLSTALASGIWCASGMDSSTQAFLCNSGTCHMGCSNG